jgi:hypothetical protein
LWLDITAETVSATLSSHGIGPKTAWSGFRAMMIAERAKLSDA